jgi:hypothetical protein
MGGEPEPASLCYFSKPSGKFPGVLEQGNQSAEQGALLAEQ